MRTGDAESERKHGALTSILQARLMDDGFQSVMDLAAASELVADVSRSQAGAGVKLSRKLDRVLAVASPLRADYVFTLTFAAVPGPVRTEHRAQSSCRQARGGTLTVLSVNTYG
jgi:hypothetical protein